jgi:hypothetical protein
MSIAEHAKINAALYKFAAGYLDRRGWFESIDGVSRNKEGFVPWITYPAFSQIERIIHPRMRVFEYGCGGSSLWWASKVAEVFSVEHDVQWARRIGKLSPDHLKIATRPMDMACPQDRQAAAEAFFAALPEFPLSGDREHDIRHGLLNREFIAYAAEITAHAKQSFDVVVVDGMARALTAWFAAQYVRPDGFIVFDNSDRWQYNGAYRMLAEQGFKRIDFHGPSPVGWWESCTSIFARDFDIFSRNVERPRGNHADIGW